MFIIKLLRRLRGFVRFSLRGGFPERVISLAARKGIAIRDVHKTENGICAYIAASDYKRLHRHARNCGCKMRVERKYGLPFFLHRNRKRKGLFAGALAALLFLSLMSHSVWVIEINGSTSLSDGEILYTLRQNGLYAGAPKRNINLISTEQNALIELPSLSWLAVSLKGSKAYVEVSDRTAPPEILPLSAPCNIVASHSGTVKRISAFRGTAAVAAGDSVAKGDLLVSGVTESGEGIHSIAEVIAVVPVKIEVFLPFSSTVKEYTGKTVKKTTLHLLNLNIPLSFFKKMSYNKYEIITETKFLDFSGGSLPIGRSVTKFLEYELVKKSLSPEEASEAAVTEARKRAQAEKRDSAVISESENVIFLPDGVLCTLELMLERDIAEEKEIYIN